MATITLLPRPARTWDSDWVQGSGYRYLDYLYDLRQLIEQNNFGPVWLVGHSLGGAIAAFFAGVFPELVSKLILLEGIGLWSRESGFGCCSQNPRVEPTDKELAGREPRRYADLETAYARMQQATLSCVLSRLFISPAWCSAVGGWTVHLEVRSVHL